jgi:hypothetical protein
MAKPRRPKFAKGMGPPTKQPSKGEIYGRPGHLTRFQYDQRHTKDHVSVNGLSWGGQVFHDVGSFKKWLGDHGVSWEHFQSVHGGAASGLAVHEKQGGSKRGQLIAQRRKSRSRPLNYVPPGERQRPPSAKNPTRVQQSEIEEAAITDRLGRMFRPELHARNRLGQFEDMLKTLRHGESARLPSGVRVQRDHQGFHVAPRKPTKSTYDAARTALGMHDKMVAAMARERGPHHPAVAAAMKSRAEQMGHGTGTPDKLPNAPDWFRQEVARTGELDVLGTPLRKPDRPGIATAGKPTPGTLLPEGTKQRMADFSAARERITRLEAQRQRALRARQRPNAMALTREIVRERRRMADMAGTKADPGNRVPNAPKQYALVPFPPEGHTVSGVSGAEHRRYVESLLPDNYKVEGITSHGAVVGGYDHYDSQMHKHVLPRLKANTPDSKEIDLTHPAMKQIPLTPRKGKADPGSLRDEHGHTSSDYAAHAREVAGATEYARSRTAASGAEDSALLAKLKSDVARARERVGVPPPRYSEKVTRQPPVLTEQEPIAGLKDMPLHEIAGHVRRDWGSQGKGVNFGAKPHLDAMQSLEHISDNYGMDSGKSIVAYFLSNAGTYKGPKAKAIKAELKRRMKSPGSKMSRREGHDLLTEGDLDMRLLEAVAERWAAGEDGDTALFARARATETALRQRIEERDIGMAKRHELAKRGAAMKDKSYPTETAGDLDNAIQAWGRSKPGKRAALKRYLMRRAKALGVGQGVIDRISALSA